jgi:multidrug efflux pump subunit AcrA (membrane-fusion protein)
MRAIPAAVGAIATAVCLGTGSLFLISESSSAQSKDVDAQSAAQVIVVRAANSCFSSAIPVTGFLVARREAIVVLSPGEKVAEVLAAEGDKVAADQTLVQITRTVPARPGAEARSETVALKSPVAGTIIRTTASVGAASTPMGIEPLFRIAVDGEMELEAEVPSIRVPEISPGQSVRVMINQSRELSGRVRLAPASVDQKTQLGHARISLERDARLQFSMFARAVINADRSCGISVPRSAVTYRTGGTNVQVVYNNLIETRSVQIGLHSDTDIEIRKGLNQGDLVVANAGTTLRDGDKVRPVDAATVRSGQR